MPEQSIANVRVAQHCRRILMLISNVCTEPQASGEMLSKKKKKKKVRYMVQQSFGETPLVPES